ncbi:MULTISPECIES: hypothetical protein [Bacillus subtilis group]|uniref:hypothetical protein n=1 Tax=Bacillus subtilis group TaxID=653685 RepID=UPI000EFD196A|nr:MULTISPECIES: hypothetical protein [Bacillus subtilis group]MCT6515552.1 hypothetical protein [Bacillus subtilis]MCV4329328.1 hypothetical protein [Bacillus velezensis]MDQ8094865.1 hypothetical protein [Bacillus amyloliquefaciens]MEC0383784.1 hypothetical protein [Bacillus velezensis]MEC0389172.1 hypothetical protein [Bacillus velezensis]
MGKEKEPRKSYLYRIKEEDREPVNEWLESQSNIAESLTLMIRAFIDRFGSEADITSYEIRKKITLDTERLLHGDLPSLNFNSNIGSQAEETPTGTQEMETPKKTVSNLNIDEDDVPELDYDNAVDPNDF